MLVRRVSLRPCWSVNDQSTYKIIKGYFKHLKAGMDKDQALRQSKLDYLEKANDFTAHPFLWSPYILIGDTRATSRNCWW